MSEYPDVMDRMTTDFHDGLTTMTPGSSKETVGEGSSESCTSSDGSIRRQSDFRPKMFRKMFKSMGSTMSVHPRKLPERLSRANPSMVDVDTREEVIHAQSAEDLPYPAKSKRSRLGREYYVNARGQVVNICRNDMETRRSSIFDSSDDASTDDEWIEAERRARPPMRIPSRALDQNLTQYYGRERTREVYSAERKKRDREAVRNVHI